MWVFSITSSLIDFIIIPVGKSCSLTVPCASLFSKASLLEYLQLSPCEFQNLSALDSEVSCHYVSLFLTPADRDLQKMVGHSTKPDCEDHAVALPVEAETSCPR
jgi:hypothetical protein